jgi:hypothetical protein
MKDSVSLMQVQKQGIQYGCSLGRAHVGNWSSAVRKSLKIAKLFGPFDPLALKNSGLNEVEGHYSIYGMYFGCLNLKWQPTTISTPQLTPL